MYKATLIVLGLLAVGGTALATGQHEYNKNKNHEIPCTQIPTDAPLIHNPHCQSSSTSSVSPKPKATPTATPTATPVVTPTPSPVSTPAASQTVRSAAPTVLPSVGGSGRLKP